MSTILLPRLDRLAVDASLAAPDELMVPVEARLVSAALPPGVRYAASGGSPVSTDQLLELRTAVLDVAIPLGYPTGTLTRQRAAFDASASALLSQHELLQEAEALRDDVWAFIATVLLPDVAAWRFPGRAPEHFHGGVRNTFQRLWMRGRILDRGEGAPDRWGLLETLNEDALVQITERPAVGADARLARALAEGWVRASRVIGSDQMQRPMRAAIIRLRLRSQIQLLGQLDDEALSRAIDGFFPASPARATEERTGVLERLFGRKRQAAAISGSLEA